MEPAARILIVGGILNLVWGYVTGFFLSSVRTRAPEASKYLNLAHVGPLMWGPILLGLAVAVPLSHTGLETLAAWLLVAASAVLDLKDTLNWLQGIRDEFLERPPGFYLGAVSALLGGVGLAILTAGVLRAP
jgi:hypothetical protein